MRRGRHKRIGPDELFPVLSPGDRPIAQSAPLIADRLQRISAKIPQTIIDDQTMYHPRLLSLDSNYTEQRGWGWGGDGLTECWKIIHAKR